LESQITEISPILFEVSVQVPWERVRKDLDAGFREVSRHAQIRGFRKGKAPRHLLEQLYGKQVRAEVQGSLVEAGLLEAVEKHELQVVARPEVEPKPIAKGQPFEFKAKIEVRPKIEELKTEGLEIWEPPLEVPDEDVDARIEELRKQHADVREPEPMRGAKDGDEVIIDYTVTIDGELKEQMGATDRNVDLGEDGLLEEFEAGLKGMQPGETKTIEVPFEEDHPNPELAGKTAVFEVSVTALRERLLPDVDDDFAQDCGEFETLLELRLDIRKQLSERLEEKRSADTRESLIDQLIELNDVPIPPAMIDQQKQQMVYEMAAFAQMMGQPLGDEIFEGIDERAGRRVKAGLLLGTLARLENVEVTREEIEERFAEMAERTGKHIAKVRAEHHGERGERLENELLEKKLMAVLREKATIHDTPKPEEPTEEEDAEAQD